MKNITMSAILIASLGTFALADETNIETSNLQKVENSEVIIDDSDISNNGFYVGLGYGIFSADCDSTIIKKSPLNFNSIVATVGYQFHENIALEARYQYTDKIVTYADMDGEELDFQYQAYGIFIKAIYPMYDNTFLAGELYALLGYGTAKETYNGFISMEDNMDGSSNMMKKSTEIKSDDSGFSWGLGYSYTFNGNWSASVEYVNYVVDAALYEGADDTFKSVNMLVSYQF